MIYFQKYLEQPNNNSKISSETPKRDVVSADDDDDDDSELSLSYDAAIALILVGITWVYAIPFC